MKNKLKKLAALGLATVMVTGLLAGCGSKPGAGGEAPDQNQTNDSEADNGEEGGKQASSNNVTLEVEVIYTGEMLDMFRTIMDDFTKETGIGIELVTPGSDYETVMKTRMASGEMPDVFVTHGWSIARYKEYLTALNDEEWFGRIDESILPIISDDDGSIYVLPVTQQVNGIVYNKTVLENASVNPTDIRTMADFKDACEKIKATGVAPIHIGGKDTWTAAVLYNAIAPAFYTAEGCQYPSGDALKDGSFDWETKGACVLEEIAGFVENGYFNSDFITADNASSLTALDEGACGFNFDTEIAKVIAVAPDAQLGIIPIPSPTENGKSQYMIGEGSCFGIWKDTGNMDAAKELLNFLSTPEIAMRVMDVDGGLPAMEGMESENATYLAFTESKTAFEGDIFYDNLFDREYFPSGMFNPMADAVIEVFMDPTEAGIKAGVEQLQTNFMDKYAAE